MSGEALGRDLRDLARGAGANLAGVLFKGLGIAFLLVLGRLYGLETTGRYLLTFAVVDVLSNVAILGLDRGVLTVAARHHAAGDFAGFHRTVRQAMVLGLAVAVPLTLLAELLAPVVAIGLFEKPDLLVPFRIMALALPLWALSAVLLFATRAARIMRHQILTKNVLEPAVKLLGALGAWSLGLELAGLSTAVPLSALAGLIAAGILYSRTVPGPRPGGLALPAQGWRDLLALAAPIGLYDLVNQLLRRIDVFLVGRFLPVGDLGIYAAVHEVASAVKPIRQAFDPILIPVLSGALGRGDRDGMLAQYRTVTRWILILQGAMLAVFLVAGRSVMGIPGPEFTPGAAALGLVGCAMVIHGVLGVSEVFLLVDRPMINLLNSLGALVAQTGLIVLLVPRYGLLGAASATLIGAALMNLARLIEVQALHGLQPFTRYHLRAAAAVAGATGTVLLFRWATAAPAGFLVDGSSAVAVLALYFALLLTLGLGSPERERVQAWLRR